jgi:hypothetical protein
VTTRQSGLDVGSSSLENSRILIGALADSSTDGDHDAPNSSSTPMLRWSLNRLATMMVPFSLAMMIGSPTPESMVRRLRFSSETGTHVSTMFESPAVAAWDLVAESVYQHEWDELLRIWALPYYGDLDFDFRQQP